MAFDNMIANLNFVVFTYVWVLDDIPIATASAYADMPVFYYSYFTDDD